MLSDERKKFIFNTVNEGKIAGAAELTDIIGMVFNHQDMPNRLWTKGEILSLIDRANSGYELLLRRKMSRFGDEDTTQP